MKKILIIMVMIGMSMLSMGKEKTIVPEGLEEGDTIGIIAPANFKGKDAEEMVTYLEGKGFKVVFGDSYYNNWYNFGGSDSVRADDINKMFKNKDIKAIFATRGGYGTIRIVDKLDYDLIKKNPKIFSGFSDITTLLVAINEKTGLVTYHGPMSSNFKNIPEVTENSFNEALLKKKADKSYNILGFDYKYDVMKDGKGEGKITGGNLSLLVASIGSEYEMNTDGKILFIEEVGEHTYRIDRMLQQLRIAGKLDNLEGIILGNFNKCNPESKVDMTLDEVFENNFRHLKIPIIKNINSGHVRPFITIPIGAKAKIDTRKGEITIDQTTKN